MKRTKIMLHHSLTEDSGTVSWNAIRRYHTTVMRMLDIGYHYGVEEVADIHNTKSIEVIVGRPETSHAAACPQGNMNDLAYHICVIGNFDLYPLSAETRHILVHRLLLPLLVRSSLTADDIIGHHDYNPAKSCPGKLFDLEAIRRLCR